MATGKNDSWTQSAAYLKQAAGLHDSLRSIYEELVREYRFYAVKHHSHPFVSYKVLAELVRSGWRPPTQPEEVDDA
jgi:hypothetical protein